MADLFKDIIPSLNKKTVYLPDMEDFQEKEISPYVLNLYYSFSIATVLFANYMNMYSTLSPKQVYDFYFGVVNNPGYIKWIKSKASFDDCKAVAHVLKCSTKEAKTYLINSLINDADMEIIRKKYESEKDYEQQPIVYGGY